MVIRTSIQRRRERWEHEMAKEERRGAAVPTLYRSTANDRFKRSFGPWLWGSMIAATLFHFVLIRYFPTLSAAESSRGLSNNFSENRPSPVRPLGLSKKIYSEITG